MITVTVMTPAGPAPRVPEPPVVDMSRCAGMTPLCEACGTATQMWGARPWCPQCGRETYAPDSPGCTRAPVRTVQTPAGPVAVCEAHGRPGAQVWR